MTIPIEDFVMQTSEQALDDLARRLDATRWPSGPDPGWTLGTDADWLREIVSYWRRDFDWRAQQARLASVLPDRVARVRGLDLYARVVRGVGPDPMPLLLLHGWPSSPVEMHRIVGPLSDPAAHGGDARDAFDVVVGSIPGHGFSSAPMDPRFGSDEAADGFRDLMVEGLGFERFGVHGGDRGAFVATGLAHRHAEHTHGIHLSLPMGIAAPPEQRPPEEEAWLAQMAAWQAEEGGYSAIQGTRPLTLAYGLSDSPVGLAAWILEKFRAWSDCDGDPLNCFTRDDLLANVMVYWLSGCLYSSARFYWAHRQAPPAAVRPVRIEVPTGIAVFPGEVMRPPRAAVERKYRLARWTELPRGGHFPALEEPELLVEEIRSFFRELRSS